MSAHPFRNSEISAFVAGKAYALQSNSQAEHFRAF